MFDKSRIIKELIPLIVVIIIALSIIQIVEVQIPNNSARYLQEASELERKGLRTLSHSTLTFRRPLFPIILASGFKLWGKSIHSASTATRIFFALNIILIYVLGRIFYSGAVGLLSSGLVLTSYGVNLTAVYINTDIVFPFFILLFLLTYYFSLSRPSRIWAVFAGICLGLALMIKESSLFCLGLPIGMIFFAPKGKRWEYGKQCLWVLGALLIPLVFLAFYLFFTSDSFLTKLEAANYAATYRIIGSARPFSDWIYLFTTDFPKTIFKYYQDFLQKVTPLSFLMVFGWFFVFIRGLISKKTSSLILTITVICALPIMLVLGYEGDRLGQTTIVYILLYIILAAFVVSCISILVNYVGKQVNNKFKKFNIFNLTNKRYLRLINILLIVVIGFFLIRAQLFDKNYSTWSEWKLGHSLAVLSKQSFTVYGRYTNEQKDAAEWLKKKTFKNSKIIADGFTNEALDFFEAADYEIPAFSPKRGMPLGSIQKRNDDTHPLYLITYTSFDSGQQRNRVIFPIFEEDIVALLKKHYPDYVVISGRGLFYRAYFNKAGWASLKFKNQDVRIYNIHLDKFEPVAFENIGVNETINDHLAWLKKNHPDEYLLFEKDIENLGLTIDKLKNSPLRFSPDQVY